MDWDELKDTVEELFDEDITNLDPDEHFTKIIIVELKKKVLAAIKDGMDLLSEQHNIAKSIWMNDNLDDFESERSIDA